MATGTTCTYNGFRAYLPQHEKGSRNDPPPKALTRQEVVCLSIFSFLLSASIILGYHIVITSGYNGTVADNYIASYTANDIIAFVLIFPGLALTSCHLFHALKRCAYHDTTNNSQPLELAKLGWKWVALLSALIFLAWMPYLLAYWPGFVFGDSGNSIRQALGTQEWSNHFPFAYTLFIKVCLGVAHHLGFSTTTGCALYSLVQMGFMASCFGFMSRWVVARANLDSFWGIVIAIGLSCTPYIATYSIAMWKDPLFSVAIVMLSLLLIDFALTKGRAAKDYRSWLPTFCIALATAILFRSNGLYIAIFILLSLLALIAITSTKHRQNYIRPLISCFITIILCVGITGPGYKVLGVQETPRAEGVGIFLNQMARVVATNGTMTEQEQDYMNQILPLDLYASTYRPGCTDMLKWDEHFNSAALENGFFSHWISMGLRNPLAYFEAWELQTCGFWTINQPLVINYQSNIASGVLRNFHPEYNVENIKYDNKLGMQSIFEFLPHDEWCLPAGLLNWLILYLAICLFLLRRPRLLLGLTPTIGLVFTLLIATPIWYWPRYEAAVYFLIPFYIATFIMLVKHREARTT